MHFSFATEKWIYRQYVRSLGRVDPPTCWLVWVQPRIEIESKSPDHLAVIYHVSPSAAYDICFGWLQRSGARQVAMVTISGRRSSNLVRFANQTYATATWHQRRLARLTSVVPP